MNRFSTCAVLYVSALIISEIMASKVVHIGWYVGPAAVIMYPFTFMLADVLAELYGGRVARQVVWVGLVVLFVLVAWTTVGTWLPSAGGATLANGAAYDRVFGFVPRIVAGSLVAYVIGETLNVTVMGWLRKKKWFGARTILSTAVGQLFDSIIFITVAFAGFIPTGMLIQMVFTQYVAKVLIEAFIGTPLAYACIRWITRAQPAAADRMAS